MPTRRTQTEVGPSKPPTGAELRTLIAHLLAGAVGQAEQHWLELLGKIEILPIVFHPRSNWRVEVAGTAAEREAIGKALEVVRQAHPYAKP